MHGRNSKSCIPVVHGSEYSKCLYEWITESITQQLIQKRFYKWVTGITDSTELFKTKQEAVFMNESLGRSPTGAIFSRIRFTVASSTGYSMDCWNTSDICVFLCRWRTAQTLWCFSFQLIIVKHFHKNLTNEYWTSGYQNHQRQTKPPHTHGHVYMNILKLI